jgi:hypothetical protein
MPRDVQRSEWKSLKDQFDELIRDERARGDDVEKLFDAEIRRRFGEMISRSLLKPKARGH